MQIAVLDCVSDSQERGTETKRENVQRTRERSRMKVVNEAEKLRTEWRDRSTINDPHVYSVIAEMNRES